MEKRKKRNETKIMLKVKRERKNPPSSLLYLKHNQENIKLIPG